MTALLFVLLMICDGISAEPEVKFPLIPAGEIEDQLNWVFATAEVIVTVWVASPLQIV